MEWIFQLFFNVSFRFRKLSVLTIFRFSFIVPTGLGGFLFIDLYKFLPLFPLKVLEIFSHLF